MIPPPIATTTSELIGVAWHWQGQAADASSARYTLEFTGDSRVLVRADCNRGSGRYSVEPDGRLALSAIALTKMGCPAGSFDTVFVRELGEVARYRLDGNTLRLELRGGGSMTFQR